MSGPGRAGQAQRPGVLQWGRAACHPGLGASCHLPVPHTGHKQLRLPAVLLTRLPPAASCLLPPPHGAAVCRWLETALPPQWCAPDARRWCQPAVTSCSSLTPRDCGQDAGVTWWRQKEGASGEGTGDSPAVSPALRRLCGAGWHSGRSAEMARLLLSPGSAAACVTLLLGCAWLGSAAQPSPGKCLGGSGGDGVGQGHLAGTPQYHVP